jgi:ferredoxin--NADP+ reductase
VQLLLDDLRDAPRLGATPGDVDDVLRKKNVKPVVYSGWTAIDERERSAGEPLGRPRVKLCSWDELLEAAEAAAQRDPA